MSDSGKSSGTTGIRIAIVVAIIAAVASIVAAWIGPGVVVNVNQQGQATAFAQIQPTIKSLENAPTQTPYIIEVTLIVPVTQIVEATRFFEVTRIVIATPFATATLNPSVLFEDNFAAGIKPEWNMQGANFSMVDGALSSQGLLNAYMGDNGWTNYAVEFDLTAVGQTFGDHGFELRVRKQDGQNYMTWHLHTVNGCKFRWTSTIDGTETEVVNSWRNGKCTGHFRIEVDGDSYRTFIDNEQLLHFVNNKFGSGGIGLLSTHNGTSFMLDNFRVLKLP